MTNDPRLDTARELAELLNQGTDVPTAIDTLGIHADELFAEDECSIFDADNNIIDFGWDEAINSLIVLRRLGRADRPSTLTPWEVHQTRKVT